VGLSAPRCLTGPVPCETLLRSRVVSPGLLVPLGVVFGEDGTPIEDSGRVLKSRRQALLSLPHLLLQVVGSGHECLRATPRRHRWTYGTGPAVKPVPQTSRRVAQLRRWWQSGLS